MAPAATRTLRSCVAAAATAAALLAAAGCARTPQDPGAAAASSGAASVDAPADARSRQRLLSAPQVRDWQARQRFEREARDFVRQSPRLDTAERERRAARLEQEIAQREQRRELSAGEAMLLRAALVQARSGSSEEEAYRMAALVGRYRADAARREAAWADRQGADPRLQDYKARERAVVSEVMAMPAIPGGLSRDAYLRQRLQAERERAWGGG